MIEVNYAKLFSILAEETLWRPLTREKDVILRINSGRIEQKTHHIHSYHCYQVTQESSERQICQFQQIDVNVTLRSLAVRRNFVIAYGLHYNSCSHLMHSSYSSVLVRKQNDRNVFRLEIDMFRSKHEIGLFLTSIIAFGCRAPSHLPLGGKSYENGSVIYSFDDDQVCFCRNNHQCLHFTGCQSLLVWAIYRSVGSCLKLQFTYHQTRL